ncbi:MAG TPA: CsbD family protein [Pseudolabrys sp.]|nr:CsbD family protein [Pseudolabrys sp.]
MDKDRIKGSVEQGKGKLKEAAGKVTGDKKLESEGKADKAAGKVENTIGGIKDKARETIESED